MAHSDNNLCCTKCVDYIIELTGRVLTAEQMEKIIEILEQEQLKKYEKQLSRM